MPLMAADKWIQRTSKAFKDRKNPLITDIDILLVEYHKPNKTDQQKLKILILIRRYCREWLSEKGDKEKCFRREYVGELRDQTAQELQGAAMQKAMQQLKAGGNRAKQGKQMEEHRVEMLQPRATAKAKYGLSSEIKLSRASAPSIDRELQQWNSVQSNPAVDEQDVVAVLDFVQDRQQKGALQRSLDYLQKRDRLSCRLQLWPDGLFHRAGSDTPHSSPADENEMYAADDMEFIYTANQPAKSGTFHHSSFLSGRPVLCAGEIKLEHGVIKHIDNGSGHYKPATQDLLNCVNLLERKYRINLANVSISDFAQTTAKWVSAAHFKQTGGRPPRPLPPPPARPATGTAPGLNA